MQNGAVAVKSVRENFFDAHSVLANFFFFFSMPPLWTSKYFRCPPTFDSPTPQCLSHSSGAPWTRPAPRSRPLLHVYIVCLSLLQSAGLGEWSPVRTSLHGSRLSNSSGAPRPRPACLSPRSCPLLHTYIACLSLVTVSRVGGVVSCQS